jgi:type IV pilus assembly protein PilV
MLSKRCNTQARGSTMLEVLVTIGILAFGLLGFAGLQNKIQVSNAESYQRAQAILLLSDMVERMNVAPAVDSSSVACTSLSTDALVIACQAQRAEAYVSGTTFGSGDGLSLPCPAAAGAARDQCEWSNNLKGAAETQSSSKVGAMSGARGCVTRVRTANPTAGVCTPAIYLVSVAWQGFGKTVASANTCAQNLYGDDGFRRVISSRIVVGIPGCT